MKKKTNTPEVPTSTDNNLSRIFLSVKADPVLGPAMLGRLPEGADSADLNALARHHLLLHFRMLDRALARLSFTRPEVMFMLDVVNGWLVTPETALLLWAELDDRLKDDLGEKWGIDGPAVVKKVRALDDASTIALITALKATWATVTRFDGNLEKAARAQGLMPNLEAVGRSL